MILTASLTHPSKIWEDFLTQEGFPWTLAEDTRSAGGILVVTGELDEAQKSGAAEHLKNGGAMLAYAGFVVGVANTAARPSFLSYLLPSSPFDDISLIDLDMPGMIPREANCMRTEQNEQAVFAGEMGGGVAVLLPFDPALALADGRSAERNFYANPDRLPWERVSAGSKGEVRRLLGRALEFLQHLRGLPYAHLWYYPSGARSVFAFRVDTDGADAKQVDDLLAKADRQKVRCSWYLDVQSHESWLEQFAQMQGHEIGLHCYEHRVSDDGEWNRENILRARDRMNRAGLDPRGYAAPYGTWHPALAEAVDSSGFDYSSEFGWAYDALPCTTFSAGRAFATLQIPFHPISVGSLSRVGYARPAMSLYFDETARGKLLRREPLFFYTHPHNECLDVVEGIFEWSRANGVLHQTAGEFASWWKKRLAVRPRLTLAGNVLKGEYASHGQSVVLRVSRPGGQEAFVPLSAETDLEAAFWNPAGRWEPPSDLRRTREPDPRRWLGAAFTALSRKFR